MEWTPSKEILNLLLEQPLNGVILLTDQIKIISINENAIRLLNLNKTIDQLIDKHLTEELVSLPLLTAFLQKIKPKAAFPQATIKTSVTEIPCQLTVIQQIFILTLETDQTLSISNTSLRAKPIEYDDITHMPSYANFATAAQLAISQLKENYIAHFVIVDLKDFDLVKDTLGQYLGNAILKIIAKRIISMCDSSSDLYSRISHHKFCLLHYQKNNHKPSATEFIDKLQAFIDHPIEIEGVKAFIQFAIGLAYFPEHGDSIESLSHSADIACNAARRLERTVIYSDELKQHSHFHLSLLHDAQYALEKNEFILFFQPKLCLRTNQIKSCEALIRWQHPSYGLLFPDRFLFLLEGSNLVHQLIYHIIELAIISIAENQNNIQIAINLSPKNLFTPKLMPWIEEKITKHGINPKKLCFEITETVLLVNNQMTREKVMELHNLGVVISLDDFGVGYSSLTHLKTLPIQQIKIDRSFIKNIHLSSKDHLIVKSIIIMARNLGIEVVAEGVENKAQKQLLIQMSCDVIQGFLIAKPMPSKQFISFLKQNSLQNW